MRRHESLWFSARKPASSRFKLRDGGSSILGLRSILTLLATGDATKDRSCGEESDNRLGRQRGLSGMSLISEC